MRQSSRLTWKVSIGLAVAGLAIPVAGCGSDGGSSTGSSTSGGGGSGGGFTLGISSYPPTVPAVGLAVRGARDQAKKKDVKVVFGHAPDAAQQQTAVQNLLAGGAQVLAIDPNDSTAIGTSVQAANQQKVPVIMWIGNNLGSGDATTFVSSSEENGGKTLGEYLVKHLGGKGTVALINGNKAQQAFALREKGFRSVISENAGIKIVAYGDGGGVEDQTYKLATDMLTKEPDVDMIVTLSDAMAAGAERAVSTGGGTAAVIGYNGDCPTLQSIRKGGISATVYQGWYEIGKKLVDAASDIHAGRTVPKEINVPPFVIDKTAIDQIKAGTYPGLKQDPDLKVSVDQAIGGCKGLS